MQQEVGGKNATAGKIFFPPEGRNKAKKQRIPRATTQRTPRWLTLILVKGRTLDVVRHELCEDDKGEKKGVGESASKIIPQKEHRNRRGYSFWLSYSRGRLLEFNI